MITEPELTQLLGLLGLYPNDFASVRNSSSVEEATQKLEDLKVRAKPGFKKLAIELHPDKTGNDTEKTEKFKKITEVMEWLQKLEIQPVPIPRFVTFVQVTVSGSNSTTTTSTTTW